jgi:hypothetical protein
MTHLSPVIRVAAGQTAAGSVPSRRRGFSPRHIGVAALLVIVIAAAGSFWLASHNPLPAAVLRVPDSDLNFGEVYEQRSFLWALPMQNPTHVPIHISSFKVSCNCTSVTPSAITISPGETAKVSLVIDLSRDNGHTPDSPVRPFEVSVVPIVEEGPVQHGWKLRGSVRQILQCSPPLVDLGQQVFRRSLPQTRWIYVTPTVPISRFEVESDVPFCTAEVAPNGGRFPVSVTVTPDCPSGPLDLSLRLVAYNLHGDRMPASRLQVTGRVRDDVQPYPGALYFGPVTIQKLEVRALTLLSSTERPFRVLDVKAPHTIAVTPQATQTQAPRASFVLTLRCDRIGQQTGHIVFEIEQLASVYTVSVPFSHYGCPAE